MAGRGADECAPGDRCPLAQMPLRANRLVWALAGGAAAAVQDRHRLLPLALMVSCKEGPRNLAAPCSVRSTL